MKSFFKKIVIGILDLEAQAVIKKYKPTIIAVTGSVGKTSTKDAIYSILKSSVYVRKSEKSFNSEIGVPLSILGCQNGWANPFIWLLNIIEGLELIFFKSNYPKCLVLEIGADHPGDIKKVTEWLKSDIAVITMVSKMPVHVEFFASPEAVLEEKLALARAVKATGKLVLPAGDPDVLAVRTAPNEDGSPSSLVNVPCLTFGIDIEGDVTASGMEIMYVEGKPAGMMFNLNYKEGGTNALNAANTQTARISLKNVVGVQHVFSAVAASAAALAYGISFEKVVQGIQEHHAPHGRMNLIAGTSGSVLIDDSYNASPDAVKEALSVMRSIELPISSSREEQTKPAKKIVVLGDMMELGKFSPEEHRKAGQLAAQALNSTPYDILVTVGIRARDMATGATDAGMAKERIWSFDTSLEAAEHMKNLVGEGDVILIKGSQSGRMERITKAFLAEPEKASELLVRQEKEWLDKK